MFWPQHVSMLALVNEDVVEGEEWLPTSNGGKRIVSMFYFFFRRTCASNQRWRVAKTTKIFHLHLCKWCCMKKKHRWRRRSNPEIQNRNQKRNKRTKFNAVLGSKLDSVSRKLFLVSCVYKYRKLSTFDMQSIYKAIRVSICHAYCSDIYFDDMCEIVNI